MLGQETTLDSQMGPLHPWVLSLLFVNGGNEWEDLNHYFHQLHRKKDASLGLPMIFAPS